MKFHWCVFVTLPFFSSLYNHKFVEKQDGIICIKIGRPSAVKSSLFYLYGKNPTITYKSLPGPLEVAEFLMIPNLKAACVAWMQKEPITVDNVYTLLELTSIYDFDLPSCTKFIRSNLPVVLQNCNMINLTYESVQYLLSDQTLSYVTMEEKYNFLIKWIKSADIRKKFFIALFDFIHIDEMTVEFIEENVKDEQLVKELKEYISLFNQTDKPGVAFIPSKINRNDTTLRYYDLHTNQMYRLNLLEDQFLHGRASDIEISANGSSIYGRITEDQPRSWERLNSSTIVAKDLATNQFPTTTIVVEGEDEVDFRYASNVFVLNSASLFISIKKDIKKSEYRLFGNSLTTSTVYNGEFKENETKIMPLLSLPDNDIRQMCVDKNNILAMLSRTKHTLFLYDCNEGQLQILRLETDYNTTLTIDDRLAETNNGFVIYNQCRVICISQSAGCLTRLKLYILPFTNKQLNVGLSTHVKRRSLTFSENYWLCHVEGTGLNKHISTIFWTNHDSFLATKTGHSIAWRSIKYPEKLRADERLLVFNLPKCARKCHLECPHCGPIAKSQYNSPGLLGKTTARPTVNDRYSHGNSYYHVDYKNNEANTSADNSNDDYSYDFDDHGAYGYDNQYGYV